MLSLIQPTQPRPFPAAATRSGSAPVPSESTAPVFNSASYQELLASLGLSPDPRLCVPAVER